MPILGGGYQNDWINKTDYDNFNQNEHVKIIDYLDWYWHEHKKKKHNYELKQTALGIKTEGIWRLL